MEAARYCAFIIYCFGCEFGRIYRKYKRIKSPPISERTKRKKESKYGTKLIFRIERMDRNNIWRKPKSRAGKTPLDAINKKSC